MTHLRTMQQQLHNKRKGGSGSDDHQAMSLPLSRPSSPFSVPSSPTLTSTSSSASSSASSSSYSSPLFFAAGGATDDPFNDSDCEPLSLFHMASAYGAPSIPPSSAVLQAYHYLLPSSSCTTVTTSSSRSFSPGSVASPLALPLPTPLTSVATTLRQYVADEQQPHVSVDVINSSSSSASCLGRTSTASSRAACVLPTEQLAAYHDGSNGSGGINIFGLMDARVRQLERAVVDFNRALDVTALGPYFGDVGAQLQIISQDTTKRLSEVSTYYNWLRQHNAPIGTTPAGYFSILPEELNMYILSFLSVPELASVQRVSRYWRRLAEDDQLWQGLHRARWGGDAHGQLVRQMSFEGSGAASDSGDEEPLCDIEARRTKRKRRGWKDIYMDGNRLEKNWKGGKYSTKLVKRSAIAQESAYCIKFDDHRMVTGGNDRCVRMLDIKSGRTLHTLAGHTAEVRSVDFDATKIVSGSRDRAVKVWDINTGQCLLTMDEHAGPVKCMQMTDNIIMSGSEDASIKMLDLNSGKVVNTFNGHVWGVACLQFKDNYIVSGSRDRRVFLWDKRITPTHFTTDGTKQCLRVMEGHSNTVRCVAFNDESIVSGSWDNTIKVWSTKTGKLKNTLDGHDGRVLHLDFDQNKIVSGSVDKTVRVWWDYETQASQPITYSLHKHQSPIFYVRFNDYGITSAARDTELIEWDFYTPSLEDMRSTRRSLLCPS